MDSERVKQLNNPMQIIINCQSLSEQFVNVGWGKKETQFHGSEGKTAAQAKMQVEEKPTSELDDKKPRIRWRGDGALFAVSFVKNSSGTLPVQKIIPDA